MTTRQHSKRSPTTMNSNGDEHEHSQEFDRIVDSIDRQLASLRIENEKAEEQDPADIFKYRPVSYVQSSSNDSFKEAKYIDLARIRELDRDSSSV
jgi:hypothetical protein